MDNPQAPSTPNTPERPARRHTIDVNILSTTPRYDFILPSYSRNRRFSSIITTIPPGIALYGGSTNVSIPIPQQNQISEETASNTEESNSRFSLEQMISYRHGQHVADKALSRPVR
ncbi:unnamed protein product [Rotaria magnacalcarata]|nr:unnamed protein product [Rotaria magnacalcarata]